MNHVVSLVLATVTPNQTSNYYTDNDTVRIVQVMYVHKFNFYIINIKMADAIKTTIGSIIALIVVVGIAIGIYYIASIPTKTVGQICTSDSQCINGACGRETAAAGAGLVCCSSGATVSYYLYDYCTDMPNGSVCWKDTMCNGGICGNNGDGFQRGICTGGARVGEYCNSDSACQNNQCGKVLLPNGDYQDQCCEYAVIGSYCARVDGSICDDDNACFTGSICVNGICAPRGQAGAVCHTSNDCQSGICTATNTFETTGVCCTYGVTVSGNDFGPKQFVCTLSVQPGGACVADDQCITGAYCDAASGNICVAYKPPGTWCLHDSECQSNACGRQTDDPPYLVCCQYGVSTDYWNDNDYCDLSVQPGGACHLDAQCITGSNCDSHVCT